MGHENRACSVAAEDMLRELYHRGEGTAPLLPSKTNMHLQSHTFLLSKTHPKASWQQGWMLMKKHMLNEEGSFPLTESGKLRAE